MVRIYLLNIFLLLTFYNSLSTEDEKRFEYQKINDDCSYFFDRLQSGANYSKNKGVIKKGEVLLPNIFNSASNIDDKNIILRCQYSYGVYNLEEEKWIFPLEYSKIQQLSIGSENYLLVGKNNKIGLYGLDGNVLIPNDYETIKKIYSSKYLLKLTKDRKSSVYNFLNKEFIICLLYTSDAADD